jgi:hypothetical protein
MSIIDKLFGHQEDPQRQPSQAPTGQPGSAQATPAAPLSADEQALARYRYMLQTAPPETIEQAHREAFEKLTPEQRRMVLQQLSTAVPEHERAAGDDPQSLARMATRAEVRQPGTMERLFGTGAAPGMGMGMGGGGGLGGMMGGSFLSSIAGGFVGSMIAQHFFNNTGMGQSFLGSGMAPSGFGGHDAKSSGDGADDDDKDDKSSDDDSTEDGQDDSADDDSATDDSDDGSDVDDSDSGDSGGDDQFA